MAVKDVDARHKAGHDEPIYWLTYESDFQGISYTTILSAMPRSAACFWIGLIASLSRIVATAGESITGPVMWISCEVYRLCTRDAILTVWPK